MASRWVTVALAIAAVAWQVVPPQAHAHAGLDHSVPHATVVCGCVGGCPEDHFHRAGEASHLPCPACHAAVTAPALLPPQPGILELAGGLLLPTSEAAPGQARLAEHPGARAPPPGLPA